MRRRWPAAAVKAPVRRAGPPAGDASADAMRRTLPPVYAAAALRLALPLAVLPLVAARVGADAFGRIGFVMVWAALLSTLVEGGFLAAATRLAVRADAPARWRLAQQVFSARLATVPAVGALSWLAVRWAGEPGGGSGEVFFVAALALTLGAPATWYLQASEQLGAWARVELAVLGALLAGCWFFADSVASYLALQLAANAALAVLGWRRLVRDLAGAGARASALWQPRQVLPGWRIGMTMLPVALAGAVYSMALPAVASGRLSRAELGTYYMADRLVRALLAGADPLYAVLYPRLVAAFDGTRAGARAALALALRWAGRGALGGAALFAVALALWPWLAAVFGSGLDAQAVGRVLHVLGWLLPLLAGWKWIGYWMLASQRHDRAYRACVVAGGIAGLAGALLFAERHGAIGLAWVALGVEGVVIAVALAGVRLNAGR